MQGMPPRPDFVALKPRAVIQERGSFFGLALFIASAYAMVTTMTISLAGVILADRLGKHAGPAAPLPHRLLTILIALQVANLICIGGTWMWKRWGIYGYFCVSALGILAAFKATGRPPTIDIVVAIAVAFAAFPRLHMFE